MRGKLPASSPLARARTVRTRPSCVHACRATPRPSALPAADLHRHDHVEVLVGLADGLEHAGAGRAGELEAHLLRVDGLQGVAEVAAIEGDLDLVALDAGVDLAGVVAR